MSQRLDDLEPLPPDPDPMEVRRAPERPLDLPDLPEEERGPRHWDDGADALRDEIERDAQRAELHASLVRPRFFHDVAGSLGGSLAAALIVQTPFLFVMLTMVLPNVKDAEGAGGTLLRAAFSHVIANVFLGVGIAVAASWQGKRSSGLLGGFAVALAGPIAAISFFLGSGMLLDPAPGGPGVLDIHASVIDEMLERRDIVAGIVFALFLRIGFWYFAARSVQGAGLDNRGYTLGVAGLLGILGTCLLAIPLVLITEPAAFALVRALVIRRFTVEDRRYARQVLGGRDPV